jgi:hypothetical protein
VFWVFAVLFSSVWSVAEFAGPRSITCGPLTVTKDIVSEEMRFAGSFILKFLYCDYRIHSRWLSEKQRLLLAAIFD